MRMINTIIEHLAKIWLLGSMVIAAYFHSTGDPLTFAGYVGLCVGWVSLCMRSPIEVHSGYATMGYSHTNELKSTDLDEGKLKRTVVAGVKQSNSDIHMPARIYEGKIKRD